MGLARALPNILVYQCTQPVREKLKFIACVEMQGRGELRGSFFDPTWENLGEQGREMLMSREANQWVGATAEEARAKCVAWWEHAFDEHRIVTKHGAAAAGSVWMIHQEKKLRVRAKNHEVQGYLDQGYEHGKHFK